MFEKIKLSSARARLREEKLYEKVIQELDKGFKREGLWIQALIKSDGSEEKAKLLYIKLRVQSIKDEIEIETEEIEKATKEEKQTAMRTPLKSEIDKAEKIRKAKESYERDKEKFQREQKERDQRLKEEYKKPS